MKLVATASPSLRVELRALIVAVGGVVVADAVWGWLSGFAVGGVSRVLAACVVMGGIAFVYAVLRPSEGLAEASAYAALWLVFTAAGCVLTYLCASVAAPLRDDVLRACDVSSGFDWRAWASMVEERPVLHAVLRAAYGSLLVQIAGSILIFALVRARGRNALLLGSALLSLVMTSAVFAAMPALGPAVTIGVPWPTDMRYVPDVLVMRAGHVGSAWRLADLQGVICFPSYHAVLAILITRAHWRLRSFWPFAALNGVMLVSIPSEGDHYFVDVAGGAVVAAAALAAWPVIARRCGDVEGLLSPALVRAEGGAAAARRLSGAADPGRAGVEAADVA